jgi:hypothetical protein
MGQSVSREAPVGRCLTEQEIAAVQAAAPGEAPEGLAHHLASCAVCQERALFGTARRQRRGGRTAPTLPSVRKAVILLLLALAALGGFLYTLRSLAGRVR